MKCFDNICFIVPTLHIGGIENYVLRFLKHVHKRQQIIVWCLKEEQGDLHACYEALDVRIIYKRVGYVNLWGLRTLFLFFKNERVDTLVDFNGNFAGLRMLVAKWAGVKKRLVFYRRSNDAFSPNVWKSLYNRLSNRLVLRYAHKVLSNSEYALEYFFPRQAKEPSRFIVIPNGIDLFTFRPLGNTLRCRRDFNLPYSAFIVGHIGRVDPAKNHSTLLKVAKLLTEKDPSIHVVFCGRGTNSDRFKERVRKIGLGDKVSLLGVQDHIPVLLNAFDVFYFPSIAEGQPNALLEAMLAGLPLIASNIASIKEVIPSSAHHLLLKPDEKEEVVKRVLEIKNNRKTRDSHTYLDWGRRHFNQLHTFKLFENEL